MKRGAERPLSNVRRKEKRKKQKRKKDHRCGFPTIKMLSGMIKGGKVIGHGSELSTSPSPNTTKK